MAVLADIKELLLQWREFRDLLKTPERIQAIEQRLAALEHRLSRPVGETCPSCGEPAFRVVASRPSQTPFGKLGVLDRDHRCDDCGYQETRVDRQG